MAIETLEKRKIELDEQNYINEYNRHKKFRNINKSVAFLIVFIILLVLTICFRISSIGFNSLEAWEVDKIELTEENLQILNDTKLNIFNGLANNKIAPKSKGTYKFSVKNKSKYDMIYNIKFEDDMKSFINMKYRLKMDNIYVKGNTDKYVSIDELDLDSIIVPKESINIYTLEWCWEDDDKNDTKVGTMKQDQYYYFKMQITSNIYEK